MKLNNRGYMLVEIILASVLAFGMAYFILNMTIELKNKNDDLLVETQVMTDQAIIMNGIIRELKGSNCSDVSNKLKIDGKKVTIDGNVVDIVNNYAKVGTISCNKNDNVITVTLPLEVTQMKDKNFDIVLDWILE